MYEVNQRIMCKNLEFRMSEHVLCVVTTVFQPFNIRGTVCLTTFNIQKDYILLHSLFIGTV
jgi:hypothetical protein